MYRYQEGHYIEGHYINWHSGIYPNTYNLESDLNGVHSAARAYSSTNFDAAGVFSASDKGQVVTSSPVSTEVMQPPGHTIRMNLAGYPLRSGCTVWMCHTYHPLMLWSKQQTCFCPTMMKITARKSQIVRAILHPWQHTHSQNPTSQAQRWQAMSHPVWLLSSEFGQRRRVRSRARRWLQLVGCAAPLMDASNFGGPDGVGESGVKPRRSLRKMRVS